MSSLLTEGDLTHEEHVVWLEDPENLDYVRQALDKTRRRNTKPPYRRDGRMVGYALLDDQAEPDPDSGLYRRRVFFLLPHDRDSLPGGLYREGAPGEAVDPRTIEVKKVGEKTPPLTEWACRHNQLAFLISLAKPVAPAPLGGTLARASSGQTLW